MTDNSVTTATLRKLEFRVMRQLNFSLQCLTSLHYLHTYLRASRACPCGRCEYEHPVLRQMVMYLLCLARLPSGLMDERPSLVAAAALYLARATLGIEGSQTPAYPHKYWSPTLQYYTGYSVADLCQSALLIYNYQLQGGGEGMVPFYKYSGESCFKVSLVAARRFEDLEFSYLYHGNSKMSNEAKQTTKPPPVPTSLILPPQASPSNTMAPSPSSPYCDPTYKMGILANRDIASRPPAAAETTASEVDGQSFQLGTSFMQWLGEQLEGKSPLVATKVTSKSEMS
jgi:hypothetical protein